MSEPVVLVEKRDEERIWVVTMNRPEKLNALNRAMREDLTQVWEEFRDDRSARVAVLTGAGDRAFSAGVDLNELRESREEAVRDGPAAAPAYQSPPRAPVGAPCAETLNLWKPVIAAVNGYAIAGGFIVALYCDIRIAAEGSRFGVAEVRWGQGGGGQLAALTRVVGLGNALELCFWGDGQIDARRAYEMGFVNQVVPPGQALVSALQWARRMVDLAPRAVRNMKQNLYRGYYVPPPEAMALGSNLDQNLRNMQDTLEGPRAFAEKRRPVFRDQ